MGFDVHEHSVGDCFEFPCSLLQAESCSLLHGFGLSERAPDGVYKIALLQPRQVSFVCARERVTSRVSARRPTHFLLLRQEKVSKEKASRRQGRCAVPCAARLARGRAELASLRQTPALIRALLRCSALPQRRCSPDIRTRNSHPSRKTRHGAPVSGLESGSRHLVFRLCLSSPAVMRSREAQAQTE